MLIGLENKPPNNPLLLLAESGVVAVDVGVLPTPNRPLWLLPDSGVAVVDGVLATVAVA